MATIDDDDYEYKKGSDQMMIYSANNDYDDAKEAMLQQRPNY